MPWTCCSTTIGRARVFFKAGVAADLQVGPSGGPERSAATSGQVRGGGSSDPPTVRVTMHRFVVPLLVGILSLTAAAQQPELPPPFPRTNATRLLENDRINVWDIVWPQGQPTALHRHIYDQVGTYYVRGGRIIRTPDGEARTNITEVGSLSTTRKGTTHIEEGNTNPPLRAVFIELKKDGPSGQPPANAGPLSFPRDGAKQLLDDDRVIAWDYTWTSGPGGLQ